jgi:hypothetical protein
VVYENTGGRYTVKYIKIQDMRNTTEMRPGGNIRILPQSLKSGNGHIYDCCLTGGPWQECEPRCAGELIAAPMNDQSRAANQIHLLVIRHGTAWRCV